MKQPLLQFKCIRVPLNHRLLRKLVKLLWEHIKKNSITTAYDYDLVTTYKFLKRLWKHPNIRRRSGSWKQTYYSKKLKENDLYIYVNGSLWFVDQGYSFYKLKPGEMNVEQLMQWIKTCWEYTPF